MSASTTTHKLYKGLFIALLLTFALVYLGPLYVMLTTSFKGIEEIRNGNILALPEALNGSAWSKAWSSACTGGDCYGLAPYFWNSMRIVLPAVFISTSKELEHSVLALSHADSVDEVLSANIAGFIHVKDVDMKEGKISFLAPSPGGLPKSILIMGSLKWLDNKS